MDAPRPLEEDARSGAIDRSALPVDASNCGACGSTALIETVMHDGTSWVHQLLCGDCRHVLESVSYLSHEPTAVR